MAREPIYRLTVYEDDDTTVLFTVSTDPGAVDPEKPHMKAPRDYAEQEVDFAKGAASIGQVTVDVVDVPTDPADQDTGWFTGVLADANGNSQCNGHRARLTEDFGLGEELVLDGVIRSVRLLDTFATYGIELRDIRERERKTKAFERTDTPTVLPRGVLGGYGRSVPTFGGTTRYPVPPTRPLRATYFSAGATLGTLDFTAEIPDRVRVTAAVRAALEHTSPLDGSSDIYVFDRWKLLWKARGSGDPYTEVTQLAHTHPSLPSGGGRGWQGEGTGAVRYMRIDNLVSGAALPTDEQEVDVIIQYDGPVSEDWPLHINDITVGELLRNLYRGDYSDEDPRIRYDEAALLTLTTPVRVRFTESVDDLRSWAEKNAYPIAHAAPTLDSEGRISPQTYLLPDASETVPELNDSNTRPVGGGWSHGSEDSVNVVTVSYFRDYLAAETETDEGARIPVEDRVRSMEAGHQNIDSASLALLGWNEIEIKSELLRVVGSPPIFSFFGDVVDEGGLQVAKRASNGLIDRFSRGGQYVEVEGLRSDADVEAIRVGSYRVLGQSWMPDYLAGTRGLSRLGQCVRRRNINASWCALTFVDAGSGAAPLGQPTLGALTSDDSGVVTIPVTALASGDPFARVDYAVSATEPATGSELWTFLDRADSVEDLTTPPLGQGKTVWVRARSELAGRRPSAYTTPDSVTTSSIPRVLQVELETDPSTGMVTVRWEPNESCAGIRLDWDRHRSNEAPTFADTDDVDASDGEYTFSDDALSPGDVLTIQLEPFPTWTGSAVSGTAGPIVEVSTASEGQPEPTVEELTYAFNPSGELVVRVRAAESGSVRIVADGTDFPTASEVEAATLRTLDSNGWFELNMGSSFPDVEVFIGSQAYEHADGSGAASPLKVSKVAVAEYGLFEGGTIGGWAIDEDSIDATGFSLNSATRRLLIGAATAVLTGVGIFAGHVGDGTYDLRAGDPAGDYFHWDESAAQLYISGEIEAASGSIGGWDITATDIIAGSGSARVVFESDTQRIMLGAATAPLVGEGVFLGLSGGEYQARFGDPSGDYFLYDGTAIVLGGEIVGAGNLVDGAVTGVKIDDEAIGENNMALGLLESRLIWGWQGANGVPTSTTIAGADTYAFDSPGSGRSAVRILINDAEGAIQVALNGTTIGSNLSGPDATSKWYVLVSSAALVEGSNTIAVWSTSGDGATVQGIEVYASVAGLADTTTNVRGLITADHILADTLTANEIAALSFSGKTATFDTGSVGGWLMTAGTLHSTVGNMTLDSDSEQILIGAASAPMTGIGIFMGSDGVGGYDFRVGNPAGEYIWFDASAGTFDINVEEFTADNPQFYGTVDIYGGWSSPVVTITDGASIGPSYGQIDVLAPGTATNLRITPTAIDALDGLLYLSAGAGIEVFDDVRFHDPITADETINNTRFKTVHRGDIAAAGGTATVVVGVSEDYAYYEVTVMAGRVGAAINPRIAAKYLVISQSGTTSVFPYVVYESLASATVGFAASSGQFTVTLTNNHATVALELPIVHITAFRGDVIGT